MEINYLTQVLVKIHKGRRHGISSLSRVISRSQSLGVPGEHGGLPDVVKTQVEHTHPLHSNSTPSVGRATISEGVDVRGDGVKSHAVQLGTLYQELRVMDPLSP